MIFEYFNMTYGMNWISIVGNHMSTKHPKYYNKYFNMTYGMTYTINTYQDGYLINEIADFFVESFEYGCVCFWILN